MDGRKTNRIATEALAFCKIRVCKRILFVIHQILAARIKRISTEGFVTLFKNSPARQVTRTLVASELPKERRNM